MQYMTDKKRSVTCFVTQVVYYVKHFAAECYLFVINFTLIKGFESHTTKRLVQLRNFRNI